MPLMKQRVTAFRKDLVKNVGTQFHLRGDIRKNRFNNNQPAFVQDTSFKAPHSIDIPAYLLQPRYKMNSREWLEKVHATVHAAVFRSMRFPLKIVLATTPKEIQPKDLPIIQVFRTSGGPASNDVRFNQDFKRYRKMYENASVHGREKETFRESVLNQNRGMEDIKLFDVSLTKKEYVDLVNKIKTNLKKINSPFSFEELNRSFFGDSKEPYYKQKSEIFYKLTKLKKDIAFSDETTPRSIGQYIFYLELSRFMTNKLVRKTIEYVEKQKTKNA